MDPSFCQAAFRGVPTLLCYHVPFAIRSKLVIHAPTFL